MIMQNIDNLPVLPIAKRIKIPIGLKHKKKYWQFGVGTSFVAIFVLSIKKWQTAVAIFVLLNSRKANLFKIIKTQFVPRSDFDLNAFT